jgi:hypothetical protein
VKAQNQQAAIAIEERLADVRLALNAQEYAISDALDNCGDIIFEHAKNDDLRLGIRLDIGCAMAKVGIEGLRYSGLTAKEKYLSTRQRLAARHIGKTSTEPLELEDVPVS